MRPHGPPQIVRNCLLQIVTFVAVWGLFGTGLQAQDGVQALIIQNGNAYDEGIDNDFGEPIRA